MKDLIQIQQKLVPNLLEEMKGRYRILQQIQLTQPIGRRTLAHNLGTTERILRAEVEFLKQQALISAETVGMSVTDSGRQLLNQLEHVMRELEGFRELEDTLSRALAIPAVYIVPGDSEKNSLVKREMGYLTARIIKEKLQEGVLAITGGSTMATVAEMTPQASSPFSVHVMPARGGMGGNVENQANTIAAALANKLGGSYWMLHVPDNLSEEAYHLLYEESHVREYLNRIKQVRMVVHGIGQAITMAKRRGTSDQILSVLLREEAVGEALGLYFAKDGRVVFAMNNSIGLQTNDMQEVEHIIAVAGGAAKAEAVIAAARGSRQDVLVTDQVCAEAMLASLL